MGRGHREGPAKRAEALGLVLGPTASEDRHTPRPNKQSGGDQDDAQDQLALEQLHDAYHHQNGGDNPQNGCTRGAVRTLGRSALSHPSGLPAIRWIDKVGNPHSGCGMWCPMGAEGIWTRALIWLTSQSRLAGDSSDPASGR
jgi:hypothetical protein